MKNRITIVDYGIGNLFSVRRALAVCGATNVNISDRGDDLLHSDKIILPGVGAFEAGIIGLHERSLVASIIKAANEGIPILGICLGMQLMATISEEFGLHKGLSLIPGKVQPIPQYDRNGNQLKMPFIGWSTLIPNNALADDDGCLAGTTNRSVYLVHSYQFIPDDPSHLLASYDYGGNLVTAAVRNKNVLGVQFHPEKSGSVGLSIIANFIK